MNKSIKNIITGIVLTAAMSNILTIEAAIYAPSEHFSNLKNIILQGNAIKEQIYYDYDINNDSKKNVLDLCRMKRYSLNNSENELLDSVSKSSMYFSPGNINVNKTKRTVTVPINIVNNSGCLRSVVFDLSYDRNSFNVSDVSTVMCDNVKYNVSGNSITCDFSSPVTENGTLVNVVLSMKDDIQNGTYKFSVSHSEAYDEYGKLGDGRINTSAENEKSVKLSGVQNMFPDDIPDPYSDKSKVKIYETINSERTKLGKSYSITLDKELSYVADIRAQELSVRYDGGTRPNGSSYDTLLSEFGLLSGRNLQLYSDDGSAEAFLSSILSNYRTYLLEKGLLKAGVGHYSSNGDDYWVLYLTA